MEVLVYRSSKKEGMYVYLPSSTRLDSLPAPVLQQLGDAELAMSLELDQGTQLAQESASKVLENLQTSGFHIQMPRDIETMLEHIAGEAVNDKQRNRD